MYLDKFESPRWVVNQTHLFGDFSDSIGKLRVVAPLLGHVWEEVVYQWQKQRFILVCKIFKLKYQQSDGDTSEE